MSGLLSVEGKKVAILSSIHGFGYVQVLHMDRNDYYGGDSASLTLKQVH